jgi:hypothetical protein
VEEASGRTLGGSGVVLRHFQDAPSCRRRAGRCCVEEKARGGGGPAVRIPRKLWMRHLPHEGKAPPRLSEAQHHQKAGGSGGEGGDRTRTFHRLYCVLVGNGEGALAVALRLP